ncbi:MAG: STAS domain-containing protein [Holophagales bacterium]|jgi:anti-anti-sigma factor|nr:STAS domain-containing protein [Holophagales bacterium]MBK9967148.1 STAS domain-containing protein [Holophagales bacterium]
MEIHRTADHGTWTVLVLEGRIDHEAAPSLESACRAELAVPGCSLALDLSSVTYLSSAGLRALLAVAKDLGPAHARIALVATRPFVREVLELSGLGRFLPQVSSIDELG